MATISLCMIVRDEEDVIGRCLSSVADLVDEIIIVDTGSADRTREIAGEYTNEVHPFTWVDDFAAARNAAFARATKDYCMWLDADDVLEETDRERFRALKESLDPAADIVMMPYHTAVDEQGNPLFTYYRERLIRNHGGPYWVGAVHEVVPLQGKIIYADAAVTHRKTRPSDPDRNLRIFEKQLALGASLDPRQQFYYARELYYHKRYEEAVRAFEAFLDGGAGWVENEIDACFLTACCYDALSDGPSALRALLRSFQYDRPRAEICCELGRRFLDAERYRVAVYWYEQALGCERDDQRGGFVLPDSYGFLPNIQLCVCHDRLGDLERAFYYNEQAGALKPDAPSFLQNREYFAQRLGKKPDA